MSELTDQKKRPHLPNVIVDVYAKLSIQHVKRLSKRLEKMRGAD